MARITSYIEDGSKLPNNFVNYLCNPECKPYEIEHIWCDHIENHSDEFEQINEFSEWRNKIGDLVLLQNGNNQSYNDMPYDEKILYYPKENILAESLCKEAYDHNPNFLNFIKDEQLPFKYHENFKKVDLLDRCELYRQISEKIWGKI